MKHPTKKHGLPDISIHVVTYNNELTIGACLEAIKRQTLKSYSVTIIDNASTDNTVTIAKKLAFRVLENDKNLGYSRAHNQAIFATTSDYILTLNPDVILDSEYLKDIIFELKKNPHVGSATGKLFRISDITQTSEMIDGMGVFLKHNRGQGLLYEHTHSSQTPKDVFPIFGPDGSAAVYSRNMLRDIAINGEIFDEDFFMHKEDIDVCWRSQLRGWKSINVPSSIAYHIRTFRPGKRTTIPQSIRTMAIRNRYFLILKNDSLKHLLKDLLPIIAYELQIGVYILFLEQQSFRAYIQVIKSLPRMLKKRKLVQTRRLVNDNYLYQWFK